VSVPSKLEFRLYNLSRGGMEEVGWSNQPLIVDLWLKGTFLFKDILK